VGIFFGNLLFVPLSALLVIAWARASDTPWSALGFRRPKSTRSLVITLVVALVLGAVFKLVAKAVVLPLLGAPPENAAYRHLAGNEAALAGMIYLIVVGAGFGEETVFRGFLFERFRTGLGTSVRARVIAVVSTALLFGLVHFPEQGLPGVQQGMLVGLVFGAVYARTRSLLPLMAAHVGFDLVAVAIIYWQWEVAVATVFFR
jgi:uncharacterized protein